MGGCGNFIGTGNINCVVTSCFSSVENGCQNTISASNIHSAIINGKQNCICSSASGSLVSGFGQTASASYSLILGGCNNSSAGKNAILTSELSIAGTNCDTIISSFRTCTNKGGFSAILVSQDSIAGCEKFNAIIASCNSQAIGGNSAAFNTKDALATECFSTIIGGCLSCSNGYVDTIILGSNIAANAVCTSFVNCLNIFDNIKI